MFHWIGIGLLIIAAIVLVFIDNPGEALGLDDDGLARLISGIALLTVIGSSVLFSYRGRVSLAFKQALSWAAIGLTLVAVYSYRAEFMGLGARVMGELVPGTPVALSQKNSTGKGTNEVEIRANSRGGFNVNALINDTSVKLIADTGATVVVLSDEDARRIGINVNGLSYNVPVNTANGRAFNAAVYLDLVEVGSIRVENVQALVAKPGQMHKSLLGMSFLQALSSFEISGSRLILRQ
jgi:aspartyl protease family protein